MKKNLFLIIALLISSNTFAATDHYLLRDGNQVQHLKITKTGDNITVSADINYESDASATKHQTCTSEISGDAKMVAKDELVMNKHIEGEARTCSLKIHLTPNGAKIEQSEECNYFAVDLCRFNSNGKELLKVK